MIERNQLKIGNYFQSSPLQDTKGEVSYNYQKIEDGKDIDECFMWAIPILITAEILKKCGFGNDGKEGNILKVNETLFLYYGNFERALKLCFYNIDYSYATYNVFSVHQLQNLYYFLTGIDLEVKL